MLVDLRGFVTVRVYVTVYFSKRRYDEISGKHCGNTVLFLFFLAIFRVVGGTVCLFFVWWGAVGGIFALKFLVYSAKEYSLIKWAGKWFLCDLGGKDGEKRAMRK